MLAAWRTHFQTVALSGETVLRELKARHPALAVIVLTAESAQRATAMELGADAFLTKPFSPMELVRTVEQLLAAATDQPLA